MRARMAEKQQQQTLAQLDAKGKDQRANQKIGEHEQAIRQKQVTAEEERQKAIQAINEKGKYLKEAYTAGLRACCKESCYIWMLRNTNIELQLSCIND